MCCGGLGQARNGLIVVGNEPTLRNEARGWGPWIDWAYAHGAVAGRPQRGEYDKAKTRKLADGKKDFLEKQKQRMAAEYGLSLPASVGNSRDGI